MPNESKLAARLLDGSGRIALDILCAQCEYNLRGLLASDRCPECAHPCEQSLDPNMLRFSRPAVVYRLTWAGALAFCSIVLVAACQLAVQLWMDLASPSVRARTMVGVAQIVIVAALVGCWALFILPEKDPEHDRATRQWRSLARVGIVGVLIVQVSSIVLQTMAAPPAGRLAPLREPLLIVSDMLAVTAMLLGCLAYLRRLAARIPSPALARNASRLHAFTWAYGGTGMLYGGWQVAELTALIDPANSTAGFIGDGVHILAAAVHLLYGLMLLVWLFRFTSQMRRVLVESVALHGGVRPDATAPRAPPV